MSDSAAALPPATSITAWRVLLRGAAALLALAIFSIWSAKGFNTGWTKNRVPVTQTDPITEIEFVTYEDRYVLGLDHLALGLAACAAIFGATFLGRRAPSSARSSS